MADLSATRGRAGWRWAVLAALVVGSALFAGGAPGVTGRVHAQTADTPQPPIGDPVQLINAYYQAFTDAVNSGGFTGLVPFFTPDAGIDSGLAPGGVSGSAQILAFFQSLPAMQGFHVDTSNVTEDDPYVDVDWRFTAAPGSLRGYLDGHDAFTVQNGLITSLQQQVDPQAAADAFMPPPSAPAPNGQGVAKTSVRIESYTFTPRVIRVPVGATVTWTNNDPDDHTVTLDDKSMDTGVIEQGVRATLTFPTAGTFFYYCTVHTGMRGKVIVGGG